MPHDDDRNVAIGRTDARARSAAGPITLPSVRRQRTCFFEADSNADLLPRVVAEGLGTLLLMLSVAGADIASQRVAHGDAFRGLALSAVAIAGTLVSLIVALGAVSGGHFNPLITGLQCLTRERSSGCAAAYVVAQLVGGALGACGTRMLFGDPTPPVIATSPSFTLLASETVASAGLMLVVIGCARGGRTETGPFAVAAWLAGAILILPSGSYANPAVTLASIASVGRTSLSAVLAIGYVGAEILGALLALLLIRFIYPKAPEGTA